MASMQHTPSSVKMKLEDVEAQADPEDEETKRWRDMERTLWTRVAQGAAIASIILNLLAMIWEASGAVVVMGIIALAVGSVVIYFQFQLQDTDTLRKVQNDLRHKVNAFAELNVELANNNTRLEGELAPLKECEAKLSSIAEKSGSDANKLRDLVKDNQKTLDVMNESLKEDVIQDMMEAVLSSERDEDGHFSDRELKRLMLRLKGLPSIAVNQNKFMEKAKLHRSISDVFNLMKTIYDDNVPEDERVFTITESPEDRM